MINWFKNKSSLIEKIENLEAKLKDYDEIAKRLLKKYMKEEDKDIEQINDLKRQNRDQRISILGATDLKELQESYK